MPRGVCQTRPSITLNFGVVRFRWWGWKPCNAGGAAVLPFKSSVSTRHVVVSSAVASSYAQSTRVERMMAAANGASAANASRVGRSPTASHPLRFPLGKVKEIVPSARSSTSVFAGCHTP